MKERPATFEKTVDLYSRLIKNQLIQLHIHPATYSEFYQIGLIGLWDAYRKFNPDKGSFSTYAFTTVRGTMLTAIRDEHKYNKAHHFYDTTMCEFFQGKSDIVLQKEIIASYCKWLSPNQAKVVTAKFLENKTFEEIALEEGVPLPKIRSWYRHAIRKLRYYEKGR